MRGRDGIGGGLVAAAAVALLAFAPSASASMATHRVEHASGGVEHAREATGYWTEARMKRAQPLDRILPASQAPAGAGTSLRPSRSDGPAGAGIDASRTTAPQLPAASSSAYAPRIRAPKYASGPVPGQYYGVYPFSAHGKLFFTIRGNPFVCSGTSVASKSRSTVLTAGHCVHDKRAGWARNIAFVPAYWAGGAPFGVWPAKLAVAPRGWVRKEHFSSDFAALKVVRAARGALGRYVGSLGLAWDQPRRQRFTAIGYPNNLFSGQAMYLCASRSAGADPFSRGPGPASTGIGCNMSHGASGGGWMISKRNQGAARPFLNSVTSYRYDSKPNLLFGPYFTEAVRNLVRAASRG